jgi:hypothetical protein
MCFVDSRPRTFAPGDVRFLSNCAELAMRAVEGRLGLAAALATDPALQALFAGSVKRSLDALTAPVALVNTAVKGWAVLYGSPAWWEALGGDPISAANCGAAGSGPDSSGSPPQGSQPAAVAASGSAGAGLLDAAGGDPAAPATTSVPGGAAGGGAAAGGTAAGAGAAAAGGDTGTVPVALLSQLLRPLGGRQAGFWRSLQIMAAGQQPFQLEAMEPLAAAAGRGGGGGGGGAGAGGGGRGVSGGPLYHLSFRPAATDSVDQHCLDATIPSWLPTGETGSLQQRQLFFVTLHPAAQPARNSIDLQLARGPPGAAPRSPAVSLSRGVGGGAEVAWPAVAADQQTPGGPPPPGAAPPAAPGVSAGGGGGEGGAISSEPIPGLHLGQLMGRGSQGAVYQVSGRWRVGCVGCVKGRGGVDDGGIYRRFKARWLLMCPPSLAYTRAARCVSSGVAPGWLVGRRTRHWSPTVATKCCKPACEEGWGVHECMQGVTATGGLQLHMRPPSMCPPPPSTDTPEAASASAHAPTLLSLQPAGAPPPPAHTPHLPPAGLAGR